MHFCIYHRDSAAGHSFALQYMPFMPCGLQMPWRGNDFGAGTTHPCIVHRAIESGRSVTIRGPSYFIHEVLLLLLHRIVLGPPADKTGQSERHERPNRQATACPTHAAAAGSGTVTYSCREVHIFRQLVQRVFPHRAWRGAPCRPRRSRRRTASAWAVCRWRAYPIQI